MTTTGTTTTTTGERRPADEPSTGAHPPSAAEPGLPAFPMRRTCPYDPPPQYARLREEEPVARVRLPSGQSAWVVSRYEDVRALLGDPRISSDRSRPGYPFLSEELEYLRHVKVFVGMDPPEHGPHRRVFVPEFTAARIRRLRPAIEAYVEECLDRMAAVHAADGVVDLVTELALPVPTRAIGELLGVPAQRMERFHELTADLMHPGEASGENTFRELVGFMRTLVAEKTARPTPDLLGRVAGSQVASGEMPAHELTLISLLLLLAGYETTANMISLGTLLLLREDEVRERVSADPSLMPQVVEEMFRYLTVAELATCRTAREDIEIGGVVIRAGEGVIPLAAAADRDPAAFPDPDRFDPFRKGPRHLAFGHGPHQCLGAHLARLELEVVFTALLRRFPGLRTAVPPQEIPLRHESVLFGADRLPVTWDADADADACADADADVPGDVVEREEAPGAGVR
ncbi:cytochrome P450 [Streptomyces sp. MST-110588]|uniref:cytochrome P450 n=1 Tax=Streptomyces sp. MST-110588 TaxID=2833628 RepID=UPI001F5DE38E|nr:cytochrome P450 [Streptomyces sp. MST-110588]UNO40770.1 cytochrome P450 [Streptomyces sp. MST-110588]